jgi:hypothetical protein
MFSIRSSVCTGVAFLALSFPVIVQAGEFGLAVTSVYYGPYDDPHECPDGLALGPEQVFMNSLPPAMKKEFEERDKRIGSSAAYITNVLSRRMGADGKDLCESPTSVKHPPMPVGQGKTSVGFDLDGGDRNSHCEHEEFASPSGQTGIDNQLARLMACVRGVRKEDNRRNQVNDELVRSGTGITLIRVSGVDDMQNDPEVKVPFYKSADRFIKDGAGEPLPDATMRADKEAVIFQASTTGKIVDGVLMTNPVDVRLVENPGDYFMRGARFQITINPNGYAEGILAGYYDTDSFWNSWKKQGGQQRELGFTCPALYEALNRLADGYKDPATGHCKAISSVFHIKAVKSFVIPAEEKTKGVS